MAFEVNPEASIALGPEASIREDAGISTAVISTRQVWPYSIAFLAVMVGIVVLFTSVNHFYLNHRVVWNVRIGSIDIGGKTVHEARELLQAHLKQMATHDAIIRTSRGDFAVRQEDFGIYFDIDAALEAAFRQGHGDNVMENLKARLKSIGSQTFVGVTPRLTPERFSGVIKSRVPVLKNNPPRDASVRFTAGRFVAEGGSAGMTFNVQPAYDRYMSSLGTLSAPDIPIDIESCDPDILLPAAEYAANLANTMARHYLVLTYTYDGYNYDRWSIYLAERRDWFEFRKTWSGTGYELHPVLKADRLKDHLNRRIAPYMYLAKEDIRIESENGQPKVIGVAKDGYYLDVRKSVVSVNEALITQKKDSLGNYLAVLDVAHLTGGIENPDNEFHISDVLATGVTDFFGSPANRKFNINHAAKRFQNIFVKPGDKFSFVHYMGKVDSTTGYLKELVIVNGDSSEPQYGGGICQVSSTLFRTIFFAGLDITQRVNHSFEVKYYRPVGLDATIFDPSPDLRFLNDTEYLLLVQNYVDLKRTKMYFKIFGKKDGRRMTFEGPIYGGTTGKENDRYQYTWYRNIEFKDGKKRRDTFHSYYKNKELVKRYIPADSVRILDSLARLANATSDSLSRDSTLIPDPNRQSE